MTGLLLLCTATARAQPQPLPSDWPGSWSLEQARTLPPCGPQGPPRTGNGALLCRPRYEVGPVQWALGFDWVTGGTFGTVPTTGGAFGGGVQLDWALLRNLDLGARYELVGFGVPGDVALSHHLLGVLKLRLFPDEVARSAWSLSVSGGEALQPVALGGNAPLLRVAIGREAGFFTGHEDALTSAVELAYEQSMGAPRWSAVLATFRVGFEGQIRPPSNLGEPAPAPFRHTTSFDLMISPWFGAGMTYGLRAAEWLSLETSATYLSAAQSSPGDSWGLIKGASWSLATGPRVQLPWPFFAPFYLQAQGGAEWLDQEPAPQVRPIVVGEVGFRLLIGCSSGMDLGFWLRGNVDSAGGLSAGGFALRFVTGDGQDAAGGHDNACLSASTPDRHAQDVIGGGISTESGPTVRIGGSAGGSVSGGLGGQVSVPAPRPVVVEVVLGPASGLLRPQALPMALLPRGARVSVELIGPAEALASFRGQLTTRLTRDGVQIDGWATVAVQSPEVRARLTISPPSY